GAETQDLAGDVLQSGFQAAVRDVVILPGGLSGLIHTAGLAGALVIRVVGQRRQKIGVERLLVRKGRGIEIQTDAVDDGRQRRVEPDRSGDIVGVVGGRVANVGGYGSV